MEYYIVWKDNAGKYRAAMAASFHESTEDGLFEMTSPELPLYGTGEYNADKLIQFLGEKFKKMVWP